MPFNSASYYRNLWRRRALERLAEARRIKAEAPSELHIRLYGEQVAAERHRQALESAVKLARSGWRLYLSQRTICNINAEIRRLGRSR